MTSQRGNPLLNHTILEILFDHLAVNDLKTARLVSPLWRQESLKKWRSSATLVITDPDEKNEYYSCSSSAIDLQSFLNLFQEETTESANKEPSSLPRLVDKPFQRYHLKNWDFVKDVANKTAFAKYFGKDICELLLEGCVGHWVANEPLYSLLRDCPNLHRLTLDNCTSYYQRRLNENRASDLVPLEKLKFLEIRKTYRSQHQLHFRAYLEAFPKLETIKLSMTEDYRVLLGELTDFLTSLRDIRMVDNSKLALKHLDISEMMQKPNDPLASTRPILGRRQMELLEQCRLPLESLKVNLGGEREVSLIRILRHYTPSLKSLWVHRTERFPAFLSLHFPSSSFEHLKDLRLYGHFANNFNFLQNLRNLEILHMYLISPIRDHSLRQEPQNHFNYEKIDVSSTSARMDNVALVLLEEIHGDFLVDDVDTLKRLTRWMPNVKRAKLLFSSRKLLSVVCSAWRNTIKEIQLQPGSDEASCLPFLNELGISMGKKNETKNDNVTSFEEKTKKVYTPSTEKDTKICNVIRSWRKTNTNKDGTRVSCRQSNLTNTGGETVQKDVVQECELSRITAMFYGDISRYIEFAKRSSSLMEGTHFNFLFVSLAMDTEIPPQSTCGPLLGMLMAVADVFGTTIDTEAWLTDATHWEAMFNQTENYYYNPVVIKIINKYVEKYDKRLPSTANQNEGLKFAEKPKEGLLNRNKNIRQRLKQIVEAETGKNGKPNPFSRMFARFLVKLWEARSARRSPVERIKSLGEKISSLATRDGVSFINEKLWGRTIIVPVELQDLFPAGKKENDADVNEEYGSEVEEETIDTQNDKAVLNDNNSKFPLLIDAAYHEQALASMLNALDEQVEKNKELKNKYDEGEQNLTDKKNMASEKKNEIADAKHSAECLADIKIIKETVGITRMNGILGGFINLVSEKEKEKLERLLRDIYLHATGGEVCGRISIEITEEDARKFKDDLAKAADPREPFVTFSHSGWLEEEHGTDNTNLNVMVDSDVINQGVMEKGDDDDGALSSHYAQHAANYDNYTASDLETLQLDKSSLNSFSESINALAPTIRIASASESHVSLEQNPEEKIKDHCNDDSTHEVTSSITDRHEAALEAVPVITGYTNLDTNGRDEEKTDTGEVM